MKYTNLLMFALVVIMLAACGAKEEKKEPQDNFTEEEQIIEIDNDTANYPEIYTSEDYGADDGIVDNDTAQAEEAPLKEPKAEEKPKVKEKPVVENKPEVKVKKHEKRYYIVVGSFKKYDNAKKLEAVFKAKGYKTWILPKVNEYNRVAIVSYVKEADARTAVKKLRIEHNDLTFWLYRW